MTQAGMDGRDLAFERESAHDLITIEVVARQNEPFGHVGVRDTDRLMECRGAGMATGLVGTWGIRADTVGTGGRMATHRVAIHAIRDYTMKKYQTSELAVVSGLNNREYNPLSSFHTGSRDVHAGLFTRKHQHVHRLDHNQHLESLLHNLQRRP